MNMKSSISQSKNQLSQIFSENNSFQEPNIRKAQFIVSSNRIYTLEFDQNIEMQELKVMIQKAAHLKKNSFSLFSEGEDYTQYTDETFDSLFPDQTLVIFTLELRLGEGNEDETELLLQINMPCPEHNYKFLLYYCFDCEKSICSECFTNGSHRGHKIQDKCFYLLPSKYLVEKMFDNWSKKPYEDFQISVDLNEYKNRLNNIVFRKLFEMLKEAQNKCNTLIDKYNIINQNSLSNIRNSVRNIKLSCIKGLDEYKDIINIKDIINNQEVFLDFDHTYKEMGKKQKEKFRENLQKFQELNKEISILVKNLINNICNNINDVLIKCLDNRQYEDIEKKINIKLIKPINEEDIINQISDKKMKIKRKKQRRTMNNNYNKFIQNINESVKREINKDNNQGRNTMMPENLSSINNLESKYNNNNNDNNFGYNSNNRNNNFLSFNEANENINNNPNDSSFQRQDNKNSINDNYTENNMDKLLNDRNSDNRNLLKDFNNNHSFNPFNIDSNNNQEQLANKNKEKESLNNIIEIENKNDLNKNNSNNNSYNNYEKNTFNNSANNSSFSNNHQINFNNEQNGHLFNTNTKVQPSPNIFDNILNKNNSNENHNYLNSVSNKRLNNTVNMDSIDEISPILDNRVTHTNNCNISSNSSLNNDINSINNINNSSRVNKEIDILNNNGENNDYVKNPFSIENIINNKNNNNQINFDSNSKSQNITLESPFSKINATISSNSNENNKNNNNYDNNSNFDSKTNNILENNNNKYLAGLANNCKIILEEANESESDLKSRKEQKYNIEYYLNKEFILCPIPTTNKLKIITAIESDENTISLNFPNNFGISSFLCNSSYCNHNRKIYISGGIDSKFFVKKFFMIDLSNKNKINDSYIYELSPMIYSRYNHSMIAQGNEIYVVGGEYSNTVEKYNIRENKWTVLSCMLKKRSNPILVIDSGYLYAFFGSGIFGQYPESIERLNLENNSSIWEMILFSNPSNIDTRCYGCGIHQVDELIYFFGGKYNEETSDGIFFFNLLERRIDYTNSKLKWKESFKENKLFELGNKMVQISDGKYFGIYLKIKTQ